MSCVRLWCVYDVITHEENTREARNAEAGIADCFKRLSSTLQEIPESNTVSNHKHVLKPRQI